MKARELIDKLKEVNPDLEVKIWHSDMDDYMNICKIHSDQEECTIIGEWSK